MRRWAAVLVAAALALAGASGCDDRQQPGEIRCVGDRGRAAPCPARWV